MIENNISSNHRRSSLALISVTGCSSTPKDIGQPYVQDKSKSFALNVGAYAGFPHVLKDNNYNHGLDTLVVSSSNAMLLADDLGSSMQRAHQIRVHWVRASDS